MPGAVIRVAHLVSHPIQYFVPLYRELSSRPEIDLRVYFYSDATVREFYDGGFGRRTCLLLCDGCPIPNWKLQGPKTRSAPTS